MALGASPDRMRGVDLSYERLGAVPASLRTRVVQADATALPFADSTFDIVAQFTTLSSIIEPSVREAVAREMARVLRPRGAILWYDMRRTARSARTIPLDTADIRRLFPAFDVTDRLVTLAPPLTRLFARRLPAIARALESLRPLRTHVLAIAWRH